MFGLDANRTVVAGHHVATLDKAIYDELSQLGDFKQIYVERSQKVNRKTWKKDYLSSRCGFVQWIAPRSRSRNRINHCHHQTVIIIDNISPCHHQTVQELYAEIT